MMKFECYQMEGETVEDPSGRVLEVMKFECYQMEGETVEVPSGRVVEVLKRSDC
jgi:hypothetical protein